MSTLSKKFIAPLILLSFLTIVFFSFALMMAHGSLGQMNSGCPFSIAGASLCPQDNMFSVIHHISSYQSFLNTPIGSSVTIILPSLLLIAVVVMFGASPPFLKPSILAEKVFESPPCNTYKRKITRWLSLFENSPSFS